MMAAVEFYHAADGAERRANRFVFVGVFIAFGEFLGPIPVASCIFLMVDGDNVLVTAFLATRSRA